MNIAELFVNLGAKGSEKTLGTLSNIKKGMGELSSMSLEAKAAIVGAVYALERLMSHSAQSGTALSNFNSLTGLSTKQLQQWQYAAQQAGVANEEFTGSLKSVYDNMAKMRLNKGAPEGMGLVATTLGFSKEDMQRAQKDVFFLMEQLQKFSHSKVPLDIQNQALKSFGLSEGTIAAMRKNVFNPQNFARAPIYGDKEISSLNKVDVAWSNLGQKIQMAMGHFTAKHGMGLVADISKVTDSVFRLVDAFTKLAEKQKVFQLLGKIFDGWALIFDKMGDVVDAVSNVGKDKQGMVHGLLQETGKFTQGLEGVTKGAWMTLTEGDQYTPRGHVSAGSGAKNTNIKVDQTLVFQHDGRDHLKNQESHKKAIGHAWKQLSAQSQGG
jgi:hypothetical protein